MKEQIFMDTKDIVYRVRQGLLEFSQTPFSDELIVSTLNTYGELAYNYMSSAVEDYLEELTVVVDAQRENRPKELLLPLRLHNFRIDKLYVYDELGTLLLEIPRVNLRDFHEQQIYNAYATYPTCWTNRKDVILLSPTSQSYTLKVMYVPKWIPLGLLEGRVVRAEANRLHLDSIPERLVEFTGSPWNLMTVTSPLGVVKARYQYSADGSSTVKILDTTLPEYEGVPILDVASRVVVNEYEHTGTGVRFFRVDGIPDTLEAGQYIDFDVLEGGNFVSSYQYENLATELLAHFNGTNDFIKPDLLNMPTSRAPAYRILEVDVEADGILVEPADPLKTVPQPFVEGYYNFAPVNRDPHRFIIQGLTEVTIDNSELIPDDEFLTIELSGPGLVPARYQGIRIAGAVWRIAAVLPAAFSDVTVYGEDYKDLAPVEALYNWATVMDSTETVLHDDACTYVSPGFGSTLVAVDGDGIVVPHGFLPPDEVIPDNTEIRITLKDTHSIVDREDDLLYTHANLLDESRLQLGFAVGAYFKTVVVQRANNGGYLQRHEFTAGMPQVALPFIYRGTPQSHYLTRKETMRDDLATLVGSGDLVSYGITVPTDSHLGDVTTYLVEATVHGLKNSLHEGTELMFENLRAHWTAVRSYGSMGKRTDSKLIRSRPQLRSWRGAR